MNKYIISALAAAMLLIGLRGSVSYAKAEYDSNPGSIGEQHRSDVSKFVEGLDKVASESENIGLEVRDIAKEQSDVASESEEALDSIEHRNSLVTFLFGTDYKRIGTLRSGLVTSQNEINRLTKAMARTTNGAVKAELQKQIDSLKAIVANTEQFIKDNESKFSILGWIVKLFSGQ